jgi:hypothetical protein
MGALEVQDWLDFHRHADGCATCRREIDHLRPVAHRLWAVRAYLDDLLSHGGHN